MRSTVKIYFLLVGETDNVSAITNLLHIQPTSIRTREQYILPEFSHYSWEFSTGAIESKSVPRVCDIIYELFSSKVKSICEIAEKFAFFPQIVIVVNADVGDGPEITLTKEFIKLAASIDAEIGFDMYYYETEDE